MAVERYFCFLEATGGALRRSCVLGPMSDLFGTSLTCAGTHVRLVLATHVSCENAGCRRHVSVVQAGTDSCGGELFVELC